MKRTMIRRAIDFCKYGGVGSFGLGIFALYIDKPSAALENTGGERAQAAKFPELVSWLPRSFTAASAALLSKFYVTQLNTFSCIAGDNHEKLMDAISKRETGQALITVSNHISTLDDPAILCCLLPWSSVVSLITRPEYSIRWTLCSQEFCYENKGSLISTFFFAGKTLPVKRGAGIDQILLQNFFDKLQEGKWVHIFPEGRVYQTGGLDGRVGPLRCKVGRLKWGVGKLIARASIHPIVITIYHTGMDKILPIDEDNHKLKSFIPRIGHEVSCIVGEAISFDDLREKYAERALPRHHTCSLESSRWHSNEEERKIFSEITKRIEDALLKLENEAKMKSKVR